MSHKLPALLQVKVNRFKSNMCCACQEINGEQIKIKKFFLLLDIKS